MQQRIIITALCALAVAGCQKQASGQTVAVVNSQEITASELNAALTSDPAIQGASANQARQLELQKLIDRTLLVQQAKSDGLDKSPEYLNRLRAATDDLLINMLVSRKVNTSQIPSASEISGYETSHPQMFANREIWTLSQIIYPLPKSQAIIAKLAATKSLDEFAQVLTSNGIQFSRNTKKVDTAVFPNDLYAQVVHIPAGMPFIATGPSNAVANVTIARTPNPTPADQAQGLAVNAMRNEQVGKVIQDRVKTLRSSAKIQYQPGFAPPAK